MSELEKYEKIIKKGKYRHYKGNYYEVLGLAYHSEDMRVMVVYRALYAQRQMWVRPASMWNETVNENGRTCRRFELVSDDIE